ncbi:MAG: hypothetical protein WC856_05220 [Methylococcaceae bacterium]|jgi:hypothetical protein
MGALLTATLSQQSSLLINDEAVASSIVYTAGLLLNYGLVVAVYLLPEASNLILLNRRIAPEGPWVLCRLFKFTPYSEMLTKLKKC